MAKPIRILQVIGVMNRGGAETMIMNLYRNIDKEKIQFDFVEHTSEEAAFDKEILSMGGRIYRCPRYTGKNHFPYAKWWKDFFNMHAEEYSAVHGHIGSTAAIYLMQAKKSGLFTIAHSHNTKGSYNVKDLVYRCLAFPTRFVADFFIGCSVQAGIDRYGNNIVQNKEKFYILNNAIDSHQYSYNVDTRNYIKKELNLEEGLVIGHVGRFENQKNHTFLIQIFLKLLETEKDAKLLLVGEGPLKKTIQDLAQQLKITENIIFLGLRSDVNCILQRMDVFVMPSLYEGLPVSLIEAQAAGLPCVISDKIPADCKITELVTSLSLTDSADVWAEHILHRANKPRRDYSTDVKNSGFDIKETAKWLEDFYIEHSGEKENNPDNIYASV